MHVDVLHLFGLPEDGKKALIVEDDVAYGKLLKMLFAQHRIESDLVTNCESTKALNLKDYALAIVDWRLGDSDGIACGKELRANAPKLRIAIHTGFPSEMIEQECRDAGFEFVPKL